MEKRAFILVKGEGSGIIANAYHNYFFPFYHYKISSNDNQGMKFKQAIKSLKKGDKVKIIILKKRTK